MRTQTTMRRTTLLNVLRIILGMMGVISLGCAKKEVEPTPPEPVRPAAVIRPEVQPSPVKGAEQGARETTLATQSLPQLNSHLEIRTIQIIAGNPVTLPGEYEGVLEVRAGRLATIVNGKSEPRERGVMWQVTKGSPVTLQAFGEVAVVRAIYLVPGEK